MAWMLGVLLLAMRNLGGWLTAQRLCRLGTAPIAGTVLDRLERLGERMDLSRPVRMLASTMVDVPMALGSLRPVVLMPLGVLRVWT